jgi:hypothetical protein
MTGNVHGGAGNLDLRVKAYLPWWCFSQLACIVHIINKIHHLTRTSQKRLEMVRAIWILRDKKRRLESAP